MAPKKKSDAPAPIKWARPGNTLKMGLVGLPNVGKSSLFNLLTKAHVPAENFPFCTIDPHEAVCTVHDDRFDWLCQQWPKAPAVPAVLKIWDIAGLVPGAHQGEGLGNAFLSHIQAVDGLFHVVRAFSGEDDNIVHSEGEVDPVRDLDIIHNELIMKDLERCEKAFDEVSRKAAQNKQKKDAKDEADALQIAMNALKAGRALRECDELFTARMVEFLRPRQFITTKPAIYIVNLSEKDFLRQKNKFLKKIFEWIQEHGGGPILPVSVEFEEGKRDNPDDKGYGEGMPSKLNDIISKGYEHLGLIHFMTAGEKEVRCWTIQKGTKAPQAAGTIHGDMERGFICLELYNIKDLKEHGNEHAVKSAGKLAHKGKDYEVVDGDIVFVKFNVTAKGK